MKALKYISVALILFSLSSCRTLEEYNVSPNQQEVGKIHPSDLMDEMLCNGALNCQQRFYDTFAELMQYTTLTSSSNEIISRYYIGPSYVNNVWNNCARWAANADHMYQLAVGIEDENYQAIALTLRAMWMDMLTSVFGYVPFSEAFKLRSDEINKPKFDSPLSIYTQLILDLEEANSLYDVDKNLPYVTKDKLFNGDVMKWKKFTNSLMLRMLMRLSNRSADMEYYWGESVAQKVRKIIYDQSTYPLMSSWEDNAVVWFSGESPFQNNWGGYTESTLAGHRGSEYFIEQLNSRNDPRKWIFFQPWSASIQWMGVKSGYPGDETESAGYPVLNFDLFLSYKLPVSFMNYDEVCFLIAEAYCRNDDDHWSAISGDVNTITDWYNKGIRASCEFWRYIYCDYMGLNGRGITDYGYDYRNFAAREPLTVTFTNGTVKTYEPVISDEAINNFIATGAAFDVKDGIRCIIEQKYMANFRICMEAYNDYRRTGYPQLAIGSGTYNSGVLPRRLEYPVTTRTTNPENYAELLNTLAATYYDGADNMLTPVWWSEAGLSMEIR